MMNKEKIKSQWFPHDYLSSIDPKMIKLIYEYGMEGYGIFWRLIETLYSNEGEYKLVDVKYLAKHIGVEEDKIMNIINTDLFEKNNGVITSKRVLNEITKRETISKKNSENGKKGANARKRNEKVI